MLRKSVPIAKTLKLAKSEKDRTKVCNLTKTIKAKFAAENGDIR